METLNSTNAEEEKFTSKNQKTINKKFICHLNFIIGSGTFGKVVYGTSIDKTSEYAIKFEKSSVKSSVIEEEIKIYQDLFPTEGVPVIHYHGEYKKYKLLVMDLLGPSLDKYFIICDKKLTLETSLYFGEEMINRIESFHNKGYIHRDIKPNNFLLGKFYSNFSKENNTVYIIDFGLSKEYLDFETQTHLPYKDNRRFVGTPRYASINTHVGIRQSRRDDIESIAYILIYFIHGSLPWQGLKAKNKAEKKEKIKEMKINFDIDSSEYETVPTLVKEFLKYSKILKYDEKPDYDYIRLLLNKVKLEYNITSIQGSKFNWEWHEYFMRAFNDPLNYKKYKGYYEKLYEGYPVIEFNEYLAILKEKMEANDSETLTPIETNIQPSKYNTETVIKKVDIVVAKKAVSNNILLNHKYNDNLKISEKKPLNSKNIDYSISPIKIKSSGNIKHINKLK